MVKIIYKCISAVSSKNLEEQLNKFYLEGFELIHESYNCNGYAHWVIMKRQED